MKRLTLLTMLVTLLSVTAFAQKGMRMRPFEGALSAPSTIFQGVARQAQPATNLTRRAAGELVTPPSGITPETWYTVGGKFYASSSSGWEDCSADMKTVNVIIDGSDVYIQGLAYWFKDAWIKGSVSGTTVAFANSQYVGEDDYGAEFLIGTEDGSTIAESIVFNYDATNGTLTAVTPFIVESGSATVIEGNIYCYWSSPVFSKTQPETPTLVVLPEGLTVEEYAMSYQDEKGALYSLPVNVAVDGNDVYFQNFSTYLPEAWVKGTKEGNLVTFPAMQYMGEYGSYGAVYAFYSGDAVFTYDAEKESYAAEGKIFGVLGERYYDNIFFNPVLTKVFEKAGTPADPTIAEVADTQYGPIVSFSVPVVDTEGNGLLTSKLSFQFFVDVEEEVSPLTFETAYYKKLTQDMTVIPYGFTENYDFYVDYIYLNMPEFKTFNKIGIQSIYTGGGEEHKSEIVWYTIKEYGYVEPTPVEAPEGLVTDTYIFSATQQENGVEGTEAYSYQTQVGFDGDDVYIKGLSANTSDMWLKATKNEAGKYVIPANQYMGQLDFYGIFTFDYYLAARDEQDQAVDVVLDYDAENSKFTTNQVVVLNASQTEWDPYQTFTNVVIEKFVEVAATPADPTFESINFTDTSYPSIYCSLATEGTNGEAVNLDKLYYTVWIEKNGEQKPYTFTAEAYGNDFDEDVTEIPYKYDGYDLYYGGEIIYFEEELEELCSWSRVGIQTIYYGAGECRKSNIVWMVNGAFLPTEITVNKNGYATFYDDNFSIVIPEGVKAYVVTEATTEKLTYTEIMDVIPAGTAVLLEAKAGTYPIVISPENVTYDGVNLLYGTNVPVMTYSSDDNCLFYKLAYGYSGGPNANKLGWYWGAENGEAFMMEAHHAWLAIPQIAASAPGYPFGSDITGISSMKVADSADSVFYDLQGRRINTPVKGLYINKNKIVIIK